MANSEEKLFEKLYGRWRKFVSCSVWLFDDGEHVKHPLGTRLARWQFVPVTWCTFTLWSQSVNIPLIRLLHTPS